MKDIYEASKALKSQLVTDRRIIHRHPEIGFDLPETMAYVDKRLTEMGIRHRMCGGPIAQKTLDDFHFAGFNITDQSTGILAEIGSGSPCFLLRADSDALMMEEENTSEFTSEVSGAAHMCGHDAHTAMLLGAAKILNDRRKELHGTVKLLFQPGEELGCGARLMVEDGILVNPKVDAALAIHVMPHTEVGTVSYSVGIGSSALNTFMIRIHGKGGHSSMPHLAIDPIMIANQLYTTLNLLPGREIDPRETVALTAGRCGGGTVANVIPDVADLQIGIRTFNRDAANHMRCRIPEIVDHTVKMWRGTYEMSEFFCPSACCDETLCEDLRPVLDSLLGADNVSIIPPMAGTEDFGHITDKVPSLMVWIGAGHEGWSPVHNPAMKINEDCLPIGTAIYAASAIEWLDQHSQK